MELKDWLKQQFDRRPEINQTSVAISIGVGQSTISKWLKGLSTPDPQNCHKLARYFNVSEDYVLSLAGHRPQIKETHAPYGDDAPGLREAMHLFRQLNDDDQERILIFMRSILQERRRARPSPSTQERPAST
jgi:transcriptional regulator with XRE-family HTH domain